MTGRSALLAALLAVLAVPTGAAAQPNPDVGKVTFRDDNVGVSECHANEDVFLRWQVDASKYTATTARYFIYTSTTSACPESADTPPATALLDPPGAIPGRGATMLYPDTGDSRLRVADFNDPISIAKVTSDPSVCDLAVDKTIYVCVRLRSSDSEADEVLASATGSFKLQLTKPGAPTDVLVTPSDEALNVSWTAPGSGAEVGGYQATAFAVPPAALADDNTTFVSKSEWVSGASRSARIAGLSNGVPYAVAVHARSLGENVGPYSDYSNSSATDRTPIPIDDFWEYYKNAGGVEQGGCASAGGLGALAALGAVGLLAFRAARRRRS
jgi:hypothetical protein